jgi:hypothetical protein
MAISKGGGPSGTAFPAKKGHGAPKAHRGSQNPPANIMAPIHTGKAELRLRNKNGFGSVMRDRENKPMRDGKGMQFGGG